MGKNKNESKMGGFEKYLLQTLREDPQARLNFLENLFDAPLPTQLRLLRQYRGLTQVLLSKKSGLAQSEIARLEKPESNPRVATLEKIDEALDLQHIPVPSELVSFWKSSLSMAMGDSYFSRIAGG